MISSENIEALRIRCGEARESHDRRRVLEHLSGLTPPTSEAYRALSDNPRAHNRRPPIEELVWPLVVLSTHPLETSFDSIAKRYVETMALIENAEKAHDAPYSHVDLAGMKLAVERAFEFLRWPQNRERVRLLLEQAPELEPHINRFEPRSATLTERALTLTSKIMRLIEERQRRRSQTSSEDQLT